MHLKVINFLIFIKNIDGPNLFSYFFSCIPTSSNIVSITEKKKVTRS